MTGKGKFHDFLFVTVFFIFLIWGLTSFWGWNTEAGIVICDNVLYPCPTLNSKVPADDETIKDESQGSLEKEFQLPLEQRLIICNNKLKEYLKRWDDLMADEHREIQRCIIAILWRE